MTMGKYKRWNANRKTEVGLAVSATYSGVGYGPIEVCVPREACH